LTVDRTRIHHGIAAIGMYALDANINGKVTMNATAWSA